MINDKGKLRNLYRIIDETSKTDDLSNGPEWVSVKDD